uniref:NADH dehydrogenase subunit 5 n=1 Tax=Taiwanaptera montana TaxID=3135762 RepID=UPI0031F36B46
MFSNYFLYGIYMFLFGFLFFVIGSCFYVLGYSLFIDYEFLSLNSISFSIGFLFDGISLIFMGSVFFISSMVVIYSYKYMYYDAYSGRFLFLVILFVASMIFMIISPNMFSILLGWDGLGLVSYCLVIYFQNVKCYSAGMLTVLTNRVGDVAILFVASFMMNSGSFLYSCMDYSYFGCSFIVFLVAIASFTSSAQLPFSAWLPAAMAAPTPVSALVHSSTLVTAGVYLLFRFEVVLDFINFQLFIFLSSVTMFMAGLGANYEFDLKKVIALSTLSQLGAMMVVLFIGSPVLAFYHLLSHAFFKSLLFLCAGLLIHCVGDTQDIRHMGGIVTYFPITCSCLLVSNFSLCGLPFLSGFYSKHAILYYMSMSGCNFMVGLLFFISTGLTVSYSFRLLYYLFSGFSGLFTCNFYFEDPVMAVPLIFLSSLSVVAGSILGWVLLPFVLVLAFSGMDLLVNVFILLSGLLGYYSSISGYFYSLSFFITKWFLGGMCFVPEGSLFLMTPVLKGSKELNKYLDMGWSEDWSSGSLVSFSYYVSVIGSFFSNNNIKLLMVGVFIIPLFVLI